jgi:dTDP-4-dehydrorhamnose reductase
MIGGAILAAYRQSGTPVLGSTRRPQNVSAGVLHIDLADDPSTWELPPLRAAIICAGITRLADCHNDPDETARINVDGISALGGRLREAGVFVIYLSTDKVFDGAIQHVAADADYCPVTEYGRQKMRAEVNLLAKGCAILRLSKVFGPHNALFAGWIAALKGGQVITPFSDMFLAPIPVQAVVSAVQLLVMARADGIWQISGGEDVSYADVGLRAAQLLDVDEALVRPMTMAESGMMPDPAGPYTSMKIDRLQSAFGLAPPDVWWTLESALMGSAVR